MKYMLASDFDGTLCQNGHISEKTLFAIKRFQDKGNLFGVVTGRDYVNGFENFKKENKFSFDFVITSNGASAYDKNGELYFSKTISADKVYKERKVAQKLIKRCMQLTSNPCGISFERTRFDFHPDFPCGISGENLNYSSLSILDDVEEFVSANAICDTIEETEGVIGILKEEFGKCINPIQNSVCIDISPVGINKGSGIELLADCLGIESKNIWVIGDNFNDISMIQKYNGCAITTGEAEVKKVAKYVCDDVADAIAIILREER